MLTGLHNIPVRNIRHGLILISSASFFSSDLRTVRKHGSLRDNNAGKICDAALGGTSLFPTGKRRRQGEEILNNMEGRGERRKEEWIFLRGRMEEGKMDETLVNRMKLGWQDGWDSGHLVSRWLGNLPWRRWSCARLLYPAIFVFHILYIYLLRLVPTMNKVIGRQEIFVTFRVSIDPGADFTFENKLSSSLLFSLKHRYYHLSIYSFIIILIIQAKTSLFSKEIPGGFIQGFFQAGFWSKGGKIVGLLFWSNLLGAEMQWSTHWRQLPNELPSDLILLGNARNTKRSFRFSKICHLLHSSHLNTSSSFHRAPAK